MANTTAASAFLWYVAGNVDNLSESDILALINDITGNGSGFSEQWWNDWGGDEYSMMSTESGS